MGHHGYMSLTVPPLLALLLVGLWGGAVLLRLQSGVSRWTSVLRDAPDFVPPDLTPLECEALEAPKRCYSVLGEMLLVAQRGGWRIGYRANQRGRAGRRPLRAWFLDPRGGEVGGLGAPSRELHRLLAPGQPGAEPVPLMRPGGPGQYAAGLSAQVRDRLRDTGLLHPRQLRPLRMALVLGSLLGLVLVLVPPLSRLLLDFDVTAHAEDFVVALLVLAVTAFAGTAAVRYPRLTATGRQQMARLRAVRAYLAASAEGRARVRARPPHGRPPLTHPGEVAWAHEQLLPYAAYYGLLVEWGAVVEADLSRVPGQPLPRWYVDNPQDRTSPPSPDVAESMGRRRPGRQQKVYRRLADQYGLAAHLQDFFVQVRDFRADGGQASLVEARNRPTP